MKEYFKYQYGYVNIDDENLYMTTTGVWSETKKLQEKPKQDTIAKEKKKERKTIVKGFLSSIVWILLLKFFFEMNNLILIFCVLVPTLHILYLYIFRKESKIKIPLKKIKYIDANDKQLTIEFLNVGGELDKEVLKNVEEKGITLIETLNMKKELI